MIAKSDKKCWKNLKKPKKMIDIGIKSWYHSWVSRSGPVCSNAVIWTATQTRRVKL